MPDKPELKLLHVCIARGTPMHIGGREVITAIGKRSVAGRVAVAPLGLHGDEQIDQSFHGGLDKAVYAYPQEHYPFWQAQRQQRMPQLWSEELPPGYVGENLCLQGLLEHQVWIGDRLRFPDCELRVESPRNPCFKFNAVMGFNTAVKTMAEQGNCGWYLSVTMAGSVCAGESFELLAGPRSMRVADVFAGQKARLMR